MRKSYGKPRLDVLTIKLPSKFVEKARPFIRGGRVKVPIVIKCRETGKILDVGLIPRRIFEGAKLIARTRKKSVSSLLESGLRKDLARKVEAAKEVTQ